MGIVLVIIALFFGTGVIVNTVELLTLTKNSLIFKACSEKVTTLDWSFESLEQTFGGLGEDIAKFFGNVTTITPDVIEAYFKYNIIFEGISIAIGLVVTVIALIILIKNYIY